MDPELQAALSKGAERLCVSFDEYMASLEVVSDELGMDFAASVAGYEPELKLVHDDNVEKLDIYNFQDIAACARKFADQLEAGEQGEPTRLIVVVETSDGLTVSVWGENVNGYGLVGLLEAAKLRAYECNVLGDD
jgi:hypothetical protein